MSVELKHPPRTTVRNDSAAGLVLRERRRQIDELGYGPTHDDQDAQGNIALVGALLAANAYGYNLFDQFGNDPWPWEGWDARKPAPTKRQRIRALSKSAALIIAELEKELRNA